MSADLNMNGTSAIPAESIIYEKGAPVESVVLVLSGRVELQSDGVRAVLNSGNFLGMFDVIQGTHSFTYKALEESTVYALPIKEWKQVCVLLEQKPQYRGLFVASMNFFISDLFKKFKIMRDEVLQVGAFIIESYETCKEVAEYTGIQAEKLMSVERMDEPAQINLPERLSYYLSACRIPLEAQKEYYSGNDYVAKYHVEEQCELLPSLIEGCHFYSEWLNRYFRVMAADERNLFYYIGKTALRVRQSGSEDGQLSDLLDKLLVRIDEVETELIELAGSAPELNRDKMEKVYFSLLSDTTGDVDAYGEEELSMLDDSLLQIIEYAPVHQKVRADFQEAIQQFLALTDKFSRSPEATKIRKNIASTFFEVYEAVAKRCFEDSEPPMAIKLFLWYGYVSEELMTEEELKKLIAQPEPGTDDTEIIVYTMYDWLRAIYMGKKKPSKDEFDMDYEDHLRQDLKEGSIDEAEMEMRMRDFDAMIHFEVENLMRHADRIMAVNRSTFVPVLCSEGIMIKMENAFVGGEAVNVAVRKVEQLDYSIFYRKALTYYEEADVSKFEVVERVVPDFILIPTYGRTGQMWQDMSGRDKFTPGRILLPVMLEAELPSEIIRLLAHFRWEKCRSEMGPEWNNYRFLSLTSEYTDYLQFYKKNKDLTPERKEKIKMQLQQCNNRHREVFTKDYQDWISRELSGSMKLNKVAREILFTYCPPCAEIQQSLVIQNSYQDAAKRYMIEKNKIEKELVAVFRRFEKAGIEVPEEVEQTKRYLLDT